MAEFETSAVQSVIRPVPEAPDFHADVRNHFVVSEEAVPKIRSKLWEAADKLGRYIPDKTQREALDTMTGVLDWVALGRPNDPVPRGVEYVTLPDSNYGTLLFDHSIPYMNVGLTYDAIDALEKVGLDKAKDMVTEDLESRKPAIIATLKQHVALSAEYQALESFARVEQMSRPLNPYERMSREAQIGEEVKTRIGYMGELIPGTLPHHLYARELTHLDDEKRQTKSKGDQRASLRRAQQHLRSEIETICEKHELAYDGKGFEVVKDERGRAMFKKRDGTEMHRYHVSSVFGQMANDLRDKFGETKDSYWNVMINNFLDAALPRILYSDTKSLPEALDQAAEKAAERVYDLFSQGILNWRNQDNLSSIVKFLKGLPEQSSVQKDHPKYLFSDHSDVKAWNWIEAEVENSGQEAAYFASKEEYMKQNNRIIGEVVKSDPGNDVPFRLLREASERSEVGELTGDENMIIMLKYFSGTPEIAGYELVGQSTDIYGFIRLSDADPHDRCDIVADPEKLLTLADEYERLNMKGLARKVRRGKATTIAQLVELVRDYSKYVLPEDPEIVPTKSWDDFAPLIRFGKMKTQCTISRDFLKLSVDHLLGEGKTKELGGEVIAGTDRAITAMGHAQLEVYDEGRTYILDATPPMPVKDVKRRFQFKNILPKRAEPTLDSDQPPVNQGVQKAENISQNVEQELNTLMTSFAERLQLAYDVPNENVLKQDVLKRLRKDEPTRRTYEVLRGVSTGRITNDEAREKLRVIIRAPEMSPQLRRRLGMDHYSQEMLVQLQSVAWRLQSIMDKQDSEKIPVEITPDKKRGREWLKRIRRRS